VCVCVCVWVGVLRDMARRISPKWCMLFCVVEFGEIFAFSFLSYTFLSHLNFCNYCVIIIQNNEFHYDIFILVNNVFWSYSPHIILSGVPLACH
jgi:hypothetical protein